MTWRQYMAPVLACLTLGLAPFAPEPHVIGKLRWAVGGAQGMRAVDWFDLAFHGAPWLWLIVVMIAGAWSALRPPRTGEPPLSKRRWILLTLAVVGAALCVVWSLRSATSS